MRGTTLVLVACLLSQSPAQQSPDAERSWDDLVAELRSLKTVAGWWAGGGTASSRFFTLSKLVIEAGREEDFRALLKDEKPVVRCMGLLALAQTQGEDAVPILRAQLADQGFIKHIQERRWSNTRTVAGFARELLADANHLERHGTPPMPLMSKRELLGIDLEIMARAPTIRHFDESAMALTRAVEASKRVPTFRYFGRLCPSLAGHEIVRVLGRLRFSPPQQDFLIKSLRDEELDAQTRLAAASALTRHTNDAAFQAIREHRETLNAFGEDNQGDQLLETTNLRAKYEKDMLPLRDHSSWRQMDQEMKARVIVAFTCQHPLALDDLLRRLGATAVEDNPDIRQTFATSLIAISRKAGDHNQSWNTYFDTAFRLAQQINWERRAESRRTLTEDECSQIEQNIKRLVPKPR